MKQLWAILLGSCWLIGSWSCQAPTPTPEEEVEAPIENETLVEDTLRLKEGRLPENWVTVELPEGYYIGFPKAPRERSSNSQKRIDYLLKRNKYRFQCSVTDLSELTSFQENKAYRLAYYEAIVEDLAEDVDATIQTQEAFYSQGIYEGSRASLQTEAAQVYLQCVIIDALLFTCSLTVYDEETPAYLQLRDRFFYSFGNRDYTHPNEEKTLKNH